MTTGKLDLPAALVVIVLGIATSLALVAISVVAGLIGGVATVFLAIGVLGGVGTSTVAGTLLMAFAALVAADRTSTVIDVVIYAAVAVVLVASLTATDLSFQARRMSRLSSEVLAGKAIAAVMAVIGGLVVSVLVLTVVLAMSWPGWIVPFPLLVLAMAFGALGRILIHHRRDLHRRRTSPNRSRTLTSIGPAPSNFSTRSAHDPYRYR